MLIAAAGEFLGAFLYAKDGRKYYGYILVS
jgi:hypothetical protein